MAGKVVLFGATGYTGSLVARTLVARGERPLLLGRDLARLRALAEELGGLEWARAEIGAPDTIRSALAPGDALISTVGPYTRYGEAAVVSAIDAGAHYFDCSSDATFTRRMLAEWDARARVSGSVLASSMGAFSSTTNLAGTIALTQAGHAARSIELAFFMVGIATQSRGSAITAEAAKDERNFEYFDGTLRDTGLCPGPSFSIDGVPAHTITLSSTDHIVLPRLHPQLRRVFWGAGIFGRVGGVIDPGPDAAQRELFTSRVAARALDETGKTLAEVCFVGPCGYDITASMLAWAATKAAREGFKSGGWLGPLGAFGQPALTQGLREAGYGQI
jgi:short subunit dehydrogenase-like uncharacterized protein